jgi:hypothetical protein
MESEKGKGLLIITFIDLLIKGRNHFTHLITPVPITGRPAFGSSKPKAVQRSFSGNLSIRIKSPHPP